MDVDGFHDNMSGILMVLSDGSKCLKDEEEFRTPLTRKQQKVDTSDETCNSD